MFMNRCDRIKPGSEMYWAAQSEQEFRIELALMYVRRGREFPLERGSIGEAA